MAAEVEPYVPPADEHALVALDEARRQIALAKSNGDTNTLKEWRDRAAAVQHYVRRRGGAKEVGDDAGEVKVRAEAALGHLDRESAPRGRPAKDTPTVSFIDAAPTTRANWRKLGELDEAGQLDDLIAHAREDESAVVDTAPVLKVVKAANTEEKHKKRRKAKADQTAQSAGHVDLRHTDAIALLESLEPASVDLLLTDPPYATDVDDIYAFVDSWVPLALSRVTDAGRIYICCGAYPDELHAYLDVLLAQSRFEIGVPLVWTYRNTLGPAPAKAYKTNWQAIMYGFGPDAPPLDSPEMLEQFTVQDISAPDGRHGTRDHAWQKPDELGERLVRHATRPGDLIVDPFVGTGTFAAAAARLGRNVIAGDTDPAMLNICAAKGLPRV